VSRQKWFNSTIAEVRKYCERTSTNLALIESLVREGLKSGYPGSQFESSNFSDGMQEVLYEQSKIGWLQSFFSRVSSKWQDLQYAYHMMTYIHPTPQNSGTGWVKGFI
jgi:hypothetical protein